MLPKTAFTTFSASVPFIPLITVDVAPPTAPSIDASKRPGDPFSEFSPRNFAIPVAAIGRTYFKIPAKLIIFPFFY